MGDFLRLGSVNCVPFAGLARTARKQQRHLACKNFTICEEKASKMSLVSHMANPWKRGIITIVH